MSHGIQFANFVSTTMSSGLATTATSLAVTSTTGFPSVNFGSDGKYFYVVLKRVSDGHQEIVKVTKTNTGSPFTIVRAQDGTTDPGTTYAAGDIIELRLNAAALDDLYTEAAFSPDTINGSVSKATPVDADELPLYDSAATTTLTKLTWANLKATMWTSLGALITAGTGKTTPVDADTFAICDSAAANATKKLTWANLKTTLTTYFDTQYPPSGSVISYAGSSAPSGWLLCYGQTVNRTTYAALFAAIGTTHGAGDGSTTFGIPDLRGRAIAGKDDMGGVAASRITSAGVSIDGTTLGAAGGAQTHTLITAEMPAHTHTQTGSGTVPCAYVGSADQSPLANSSSNTGSTGGGGAHNNVQPTIILNYIIKT